MTRPKLQFDGTALKRIRESKGLTQRELADQVRAKLEGKNTAPQSISDWESGRGCPDFDTVLAISEVLGVPLHSLTRPAPKPTTKAPA